MFRLRTGLFSLLILATLILPQSVWSQARLGIRGGITVDPDQIHFGMHGRGAIAPHVRFQPNIEIGIGDNLTIIAINPEFVYVFITRDKVTPYAGGGPGIHLIDRDRPFDSTTTEIGINFLGGFDFPIANGRSVMIELKVGAGDIPELKLTGGVTF